MTAPVRLELKLARQVGIHTYLIAPLSFLLWLIIVRSIIIRHFLCACGAFNKMLKKRGEEEKEREEREEEEKKRGEKRERRRKEDN